MFSTIFKFEVKRWFNNPAFYIYCLVFFLISLGIMAASLGIFDGATATTSNPVKANSPLSINGFLNGLSQFVYFLIPTIIGGSVYRDYKYNMHNVLFSYPLNKGTYLSAKFLSSLFITILVVLTTVLGFIVAQFLPGVNEGLLGPFDVWACLQSMVYLVLPNLILFGGIIFALVTFTRNIYIGFIFILLLFVFQSVLVVLTSDTDNRYMVSLLDPFGFEAIQYLTKYWTIYEKNNNDLPFYGVVLYNRLIWLAVSAGILAFVYYVFSFDQGPITFGKRKQKGERVVKNNFGSIIRVNLPKVDYDFSFLSRLKTSWNLSKYDFKFIIKNWGFIVLLTVTAITVLLTIAFSGQVYGTETLPLTWQMLESIGGVFSFFIYILIFLFAGILIHKSATDRINLLIEATAVPNWVLLFSKVIALVKMVVFVLLISMLTGIVYQAYNGFYNFEIGHYIQELFGLDMLKYIVMIFFALFINSLFKNYAAGFIVCLVIFIGMPMLRFVGVEQSIFKFNTGPSYSYSDLDGYGFLMPYLTYRIYWILFGLILLCLTYLLWRRGIVSSAKERIAIAKKRFKPAVYIPLFLFVIGFVGLGATIYYHNNIEDRFVSSKEAEQDQVNYEKQYGKYRSYPQPRIVDTKLKFDVYPDELGYKAEVIYTAQNKSDQVIDTLLIAYTKELQAIVIGNQAKLISRDSLLDVNVYVLQKPLQPNELLEIKSTLENQKNTFLKKKSPILQNGTFVNNSLFPSIGYVEAAELVDNNVRKKYNLPERERMAEPTDSSALHNTYISSEADWIQFEATLSTSKDQIAIAPGILIKEWEEGDRRYFHYKMDQKMLNFYSIISANYEVKRDKVDGVNLEIYYHKGHEYNLDRMMNSMKKSFQYYQQEFSPYQFNQMRIVEFPKTHGTFAQAFANTVPFSETIGFIAKVEDENPNKVDYAYSVTAHELAHQWWAHQVIGANVKGATMLSESLAEYSSLKVVEHTYGKGQMRKYLKDALDKYLTGRTFEQIKENPLMYNENQQHIHYNKGSLVMYAMSELLGEQSFNAFLKEYISQVAFQEPPYTTSIEFVNLLKSRTPDSLQYAIKDMYETITLYDNAIQNVSYKKIADNKYQVDIEFNVSKYRAGEKGAKSYEDQKGQALKTKVNTSEIQSLPLKDYIEIGIFGEPKKYNDKFTVDNEIYLKKHKIDKINNKVTIFVSEKPVEVGVDPYNKLIDTNSDDNRRQINLKCR